MKNLSPHHREDIIFIFHFITITILLPLSGFQFPLFLKFL